ncbi:MAG: hypothetical protein WC455_21535 [Dehalococcoidia bacterium]|jgi:hypothetical protein
MAEEITARDVELIRLNEKIERLEAIVDLYIRPNEFLFDQDDAVCSDARRVVARRVERDRENLESITDLREDLADHGRKIKALEAGPKTALTTAKIHERKLKKVETVLVSHNNQPMSFSDMGKMLGYKKETRRQQMTKLGAAFKLYPDRYEVRDSNLGGKTVRLVTAYLNHLLK